MTSSNVLKQVVRWLILPVVMTAVGFFLVWPLLATTLAAQPLAHVVKDFVGGSSASNSTANESAPSGKFRSVELDVSISKDKSESASNRSSSKSTSTTRQSNYFRPESETEPTEPDAGGW